MPVYGDALHAYAHAALWRDGFGCRYYGLDGRVWPHCLYLSWDHLLPKGHSERDDPGYVAAARRFCHEFAKPTTWDVAVKSPHEFVAQEKPVVLAVRAGYRVFRESEVVTTPP